MKERPIIFNTNMVCALLDGRKTQTRRIISLPPPYSSGYHEIDAVFLAGQLKCHYGEIADRLWVKEKWGVGTRPHPVYGWVDGVEYRADELLIDDGDDLPLHDRDIEYENYAGKGWLTPMFMPRKASRITLEITNIRAERVQSISEQDALAEGINSIVDNGTVRYENYNFVDGKVKDRTKYKGSMTTDPVQSFQTLWDSINDKRGYGWESNPWVWVIEFKEVQP